jgi:hypothetical protein
MILEVTKCDEFLGILLNVFTPTTDVAINPGSALATIYQMDPTNASGFVPVAAIAPVALAQVNAVAGLWGCAIDITGYNTRNLVVVVTAVVGGLNRTAIKVLGTQVGARQISVGGPSITVTPGPSVQEAKI